MEDDMVIIELRECSFVFTVKSYNTGKEKLFAVNFATGFSGGHYTLWSEGNICEKGLTDKPHTANGAKVLLIDHLLKLKRHGNNPLV